MNQIWKMVEKELDNESLDTLEMTKIPAITPETKEKNKTLIVKEICRIGLTQAQKAA
jgi:hypothetical protein